MTNFDPLVLARQQATSNRNCFWLTSPTMGIYWKSTGRLSNGRKSCVIETQDQIQSGRGLIGCLWGRGQGRLLTDRKGPTERAYAQGHKG